MLNLQNELIKKIDRKLYHVVQLNYELYFKEEHELALNIHSKVNALVTQIMYLKQAHQA